MISGEDIYVNGDGETSRDFCFIENTVQANLLAATSTSAESLNQVYNVAVGDRTTLNQLFSLLAAELSKNAVVYQRSPVYRDFRAGDVKHSQADIGKAKALLGYAPKYSVEQGIAVAMPWYVNALAQGVK